MAQSTPSACNRQGWSVKIIVDKEILHNILANQNGNRGFGDEIDKLILVTGNLRAFNKSRELHQVFVDGGMYAMNVLHCLHYQHIGSIPLSAALSPKQEKNIKKFYKCLILKFQSFLLVWVVIQKDVKPHVQKGIKQDIKFFNYLSDCTI